MIEDKMWEAFGKYARTNIAMGYDYVREEDFEELIKDCEVIIDDILARRK